MFQAKRGYPEGALTHFVSMVNKIRVQMSYLHLDPYFVDPAQEMYPYSLRFPLVCFNIYQCDGVNKAVLTYISVLVGFFVK
jgi:hypothetical protein